MTEWVSELQAALATEFGDEPHLVTLATVDKSGFPRARTIVCRKVADDGALYFVSDARSEKNEQVKAVAQAEAVFWLPTLRQQFRLFGGARIAGGVGDPARLEFWKQLSDAGRALFTWPNPGVRRIDAPESFATGVPATVTPPVNFELIVLRPKRVEHLDLNPHPHRRRRWMLTGAWSAGAELNP